MQVADWSIQNVPNHSTLKEQSLQWKIVAFRQFSSIYNFHNPNTSKLERVEFPFKNNNVEYGARDGVGGEEGA